MTKNGFNKISDDSQKLFTQALSLEAAFRTWMVRKGYPLYQKAQEQRWMTQNASEGKTWKAIKPAYESWKIKKQAEDSGKYPGGKRVLVLTTDLFNSVVGRDLKYHRAIFEKKGFYVATTIPYGKYVNDVRPFVGFGKKTTDSITNSLKTFARSHLARRSIK